MHFEGNVSIRAARDEVWRFLTDPHRVSRCVPGVESVEIVEPGRKFRAAASVGLGGVKARFAGDVEFVELDAPNRAKVKGHGTAPGSAADVTSEMVLSDGPDGTTQMLWSADLVVLGTLASLAARLMGSVTESLTREFFNCMKSKVEGQSIPAART